MAVVRVLSPYVARVIVANPMQVKAIAHARVKTDKIDAGTFDRVESQRRFSCKIVRAPENVAPKLSSRRSSL
jgi:hypothetical protein